MANEGAGSEQSNAFSRIPTWDGDASKWRKYKKDVEIWMEGENLEVNYSVAARMVQRRSGTARIRASLLDPVDL